MNDSGNHNVGKFTRVDEDMFLSNLISFMASSYQFVDSLMKGKPEEIDKPIEYNQEKEDRIQELERQISDREEELFVVLTDDDRQKLIENVKQKIMDKEKELEELKNEMQHMGKTEKAGDRIEESLQPKKSLPETWTVEVPRPIPIIQKVAENSTKMQQHSFQHFSVPPPAVCVGQQAEYRQQTQCMQTTHQIQAPQSMHSSARSLPQVIPPFNQRPRVAQKPQYYQEKQVINSNYQKGKAGKTPQGNRPTLIPSYQYRSQNLPPEYCAARSYCQDNNSMKSNDFQQHHIHEDPRDPCVCGTNRL